MKKITLKQIETKLGNAKRTHDKTQSSKHEKDRIPFDNALYSYSDMYWQSRHKQFKGCNGKCTFNPFTLDAYSYGHWLFVKLIRGKVVFNDHNYSMTTKTHQKAVFGLLSHLGIKIDLTVDMRNCLNNFELDALKPMYRQMIMLEISSRRKGVKANTLKENAKSIKKIQAEIKLVRKLGAVFNSEQIAELRSLLEQNEIERLDRSKVEREYNSKLNKLSRTILNESFEAPVSTVKPQIVANVYPLDKREKKDNMKVALAAFLNTNTTREKFGSYFIDGNKLTYRVMTTKKRYLNQETVSELLTGIQNKRAACLDTTISELVALKLKSEFCDKAVTYRILEENIIAIKESDTPDGKVNIVGNASRLNLIGRITAFGNTRNNYWETPIQKELKEIADCYYEFDKNSVVLG